MEFFMKVSFLVETATIILICLNNIILATSF